jgi:type IV pilus assembly protein PilM
MTPWNAANDFVESRNAMSRNARDVSQVADPSASFDPARTGDPSPGTTGRADLGVGYVGRGGAVGLPGRNPIGFAPSDPERELPDEPRFRTEISSKRHHAPVSPRASSRSDSGSGDEPESGSADLVWQLPAPETEGRERVEETEADVPASSTGDGGTETKPEAHDEPAAEEPQLVEEPVGGTDEKVPLYKRELSFRRRKAEPEAATFVESVVAELVADEPVFVEPVFVEPVAEEPVSEEPVVDEPVADEPVSEEAVMAELVVDEPVVAEPALDGPQAEAPAFDEPTPVDAPVAVEPVADSKSGGRSFGRKRNGSPLAAPARKSGRGSRGKTIVGLKIGASQIAAAVVTENDGRYELVQLARRPIDSGLVVDGEIRDADALAHQLKLFFDEHKLPRKDVRIGLASNRIGVRTFEIAGIDDETRFDNAVRFKAHEVLPVAQHESVLDYRVLEERPTEAGEPSRRILLVVAPRDQVEPYVRVAQQAGIRLAGLDLEALSLLRAFVDPKPFAVRAVDDTSTVIVSIGHESTTLLVAGGGACEFTRVFDWGGGTLQDAVVQELDVHHAEAATILRHLSLSGPGRQYETLDEAARTRTIAAVRLRLTPFARELVSSLQFYQTQPDSLGIGEIVITGGTSHLEGLGEALHQMIGVSVRVGDPLARVHVSGELDSAIEATIGSMAVPIGLAIEDERRRSVNLLPTDVRAAARKRPNLVAIALPVAVAVPVAALGFMFVSAHGKVSDSQAELDAVSAQIDALPTPQGPVIDVSLQGAQAQRAQAVANVLGSRVAWDAVLRDVSRVLPENVWLSSLQAQVAATPAAGTIPVAATVTPGVPAAPTGALIDGYTYAQTDVARLLARLATLPTLSNVTLTSSKVELKGEKSVVHFQIAADLNTGGS